jgi:hypothetical protein
LSGGFYARASGFASISFGDSTTASGRAAVAFGDSTRALGANSLAIGNRTTAQGANTLTSGFKTQAVGNESVAIGNNTFANGIGAIAMGSNVTAGANKSFAMGSAVNMQHLGSFGFGDDILSASTLTSSAINQLSARFRGGYQFFTNATNTIGVSLAADGNSWATISDSTKKENFISAPNDILEKIANMKIGTWNYKTQEKSVRHWGPMAQDFYTNFGKDAFGTIGNDTTIASADIDGVMMAAIKALILENKALQKKNEQLEAKLEQIADLLLEKNKVSARD